MNKELQTALTHLLEAVTALIHLELKGKIGDEPVVTETKSKKAKPAPIEDEQDLSDESDEDADNSGDTGDADDVEAETEEEEEESDVSLEDVIDAIKAFVGKNKKGEREKAIALLKKKFATGNVNKLDSKHYSAAIKLFSK